MLDSTTAAPNATAAALAGVRVVYIAEEPQARRLLAEMVASGRVAIDIETAPNRPAVERLGTLLREQADTVGALKALRKLKASEDKVGALTAKARRLAAEIKYTSTKSAGLDPHRARIRLIQIYNGGDCVLVVDLDHTGTGVLELLDGVSIVAHNAAFELAFLEAAGVALGEIQCTAQMARLTLGEHATSLGDAAATYLGLDLDKTLQSSDWNAPRLTRQQIDYAAVDAVVTWRIAEKTLHRLDIQRSAYEIQMGAIPAVVRMEQRGFKIDIEAHARLIEELAQRRVVAEQRYRDACLGTGHVELALANRAPSTPAQKAALLTTLLSSDELARWRKTTKSGALSTKRSELLRAAHYPPLRALVDLSRIDKLMSSFGPTLTALVSPVTGRIHAHYRVAGANTGRATCSGPNLQQIPRSPDDPDDPVDFRALFLPEPDYAIVVADYSSMELRAAAHIYGDPAMTRAFEEGQDLHYLTAARVTGKAIEDVTRDERKGAKAVNFGAIYGQGAAGLVQSAWDNYELVLDSYEAQRWHATFAQTFPALVRGRSEHYDRCVAARRIVIGKDAKHGVGRIFPFSRLKPGSNGYTHSCNLPVQGACADASMLALAYVDDRLFEAGIDGGPVAWLHDEIVIEVREDQAERAVEILKQSMIDGFAETFPGAPLNGLVEPHIGLNWCEAKAGEMQRISPRARPPRFHPLPEPNSGPGLCSSASSVRARGRHLRWHSPL